MSKKSRSECRQGQQMCVLFSKLRKSIQYERKVYCNLLPSLTKTYMSGGVPENGLLRIWINLFLMIHVQNVRRRDERHPQDLNKWCH